MPTSDLFSVVTVPFPYVERNGVKRRPALLVSHPDFGRRHGLGWVLMITSADNEPWPGDLSIDDLRRAGLRAPSVVRPAKIATVDLARVMRIGEVSEAISLSVRKSLGATLAGPGAPFRGNESTP